MIAIIEGCGANISSVQYALQRLGMQAELTTDTKKIRAASHVILPGVGTAKNAMQQLQQSGLMTVIKQLTQPVLGICLGMQLLYESSTEGGEVACLGILPGQVQHLPKKSSLTLPHMGWNQLRFQPHPLLEKIMPDSYSYFVHSYYAPVNEYTIAVCDYSTAFSAVVQKDNFYAMQFHPEKSGQVGRQLLRNFFHLDNPKSGS